MQIFFSRAPYIYGVQKVEEESVFLGQNHLRYEKSSPTLFPLQIWPGESWKSPRPHSSGHTALFILGPAHSKHFIIENDNLCLKVGQTKKQFHVEYESAILWTWVGRMHKQVVL